MFRLWRSSLSLMLVLMTLIGPVGAAPRTLNAPGDLDTTFAGFGANGLISITMYRHMVRYDLMHALASCLAVGFFRSTVWNRDE